MFNQEKKYFKKKLIAIQRLIWDLEFKRFKLGLEREERRTNYDNLRSKLANLEEQMKTEDAKPADDKTKLNKDERARLDDKKVILDRDIEREKKSLDEIDIEVQGSRPTNEYPDGITGINKQIEAFHELKVIVKEYLKLI